MNSSQSTVASICQAITTNGKPCKKKSKKNACFCNTHITATGGSNEPNIPTTVEKRNGNSTCKKSNNTREVEIREIRGIPYYIDKNGHVYKHEEIQQDNPSIIGHFNSQTCVIEFIDK